MLLATVSAEAGYTCTNPEDAWTVTAVEGATDGASCGTEGTALATDATLDYCLAAVVVPAVEADAEADPAVEAVAESLTSCNLYSLATAADADIRTAAAAAEDGSAAYHAWAWGAGVALADLAPAAEGDADSAKMITSAVATIAAIAMVAY